MSTFPEPNPNEPLQTSVPQEHTPPATDNFASDSTPTTSDNTAQDKPAFTPHPADKKAFFDKRLTDRPERFEDFTAWQEARRFVNRVFEITEQGKFSDRLSLQTAIRDAAVETMSRIAAAVESGGDRDFQRGLNQASSSAAAVRSLMYVTIDQQRLPEGEANELIGRAASLNRMLASQIARLRRSDTMDFKRKSNRPGGGGGKRPPGKFGGKSSNKYGNSDHSGQSNFRPKRNHDR